MIPRRTRPHFPTISSLAIWLACAAALSAADVVNLPVVDVTADRLPVDSQRQPFSVTTVDRDELRTAPQLRLDDLLRNASPGFSLFRRSSSRVANPTTQGVSLRNIGPNGAGRTLVLYDGIPLNDPFAGWVPWSRVPPESVGEILINSGGGAGLFGNAAIAGTIYLVPTEPEHDGVRVVGTVGDRDTYEASASADLVSEKFTLSTFVDRFSTGGYPVLQGNQRGKVDTDADADSWVWQSRLGWKPDEWTKITLSGSAFEEHRGNGTLYTRNGNRGQDFSVAAQRFLPTLEADIRVQAYLQRRQFFSTFSSVNADRSVETPALDQFDVPATAAGGSVVWNQQIGDDHRVIGGVDFRWVEGETNERYSWNGTDFARARNAGGRQAFIGIFLEENWKLSDAVQVVAGGRVDYWRQFDGMRTERDRLAGIILQDARYEEQDGVEPNGRLGVSAQLTSALRARVAGYTGFRAPTLNELYRPFRVGNDITEANPALEPERLAGVETGFDWQPIKPIRFSVTGFYNQLHDAIGNVTIGAGPGTFVPGGFVPAGGVLRQRRNLDRVDVLGLEAAFVWQLNDHWRLRAQYLYTHPTVEKSAAAPQLEGRLLAQAPEHVAVGAIDWSAGNWRAVAQIRYTGRQFEDDLNSLSLAPYTTVDFSLGYTFSEHLSALARVENLFDTESETGRTASGLVSIGAPRAVSLTITLQF